MYTRRTGCPDAPKIWRLGDPGRLVWRFPCLAAVLVAPKIGSRKAGKPKTADPRKILPVRKHKNKDGSPPKLEF